MRKLRILMIIILLCGILIYCLPLLYLKLEVQPSEQYSEVPYLDTISHKHALIIVAHNDDCFGSVAVTKWLCSRGWEVRAFYFKAPSFLKDSIRELNGINSAKKVRDLIGLTEFTLIDQPLRQDSPVSDMNVPYSEFTATFRSDTIESVIENLISIHQPSVIFTLDDIIGFYGHADHIFVSRAILNVCNRNKSNTGFPVQLIVQSVLPHSVAEGVMVKYQKLHHFRSPWGIRKLIKERGFGESVYTKAKKIYKCDGMPLPDIQFRIDTLSLYKRQFLDSWAPSEKKSLRRFIPFSYWYPHGIYYKMFNYEYFRVIDI
jgi:hypothetical protein